MKTEQAEYPGHFGYDILETKQPPLYAHPTVKHFVGRLKTDGPVWFVAAITFLNGLFEIIDITFSRFGMLARFLTFVLPFGIPQVSRSVALLLGFVLIYLSLNLLQRKRIAWYLTMITIVIIVFTHIGIGRTHFIHTLIAPLLTLAVLLLFRKKFTVRNEPESIRRGIMLASISIIAALVYGIIGFWLLDKRDFGIDFQLRDSVIKTLCELAINCDIGIVPYTRHARWFLESLDVFGITAFIFALYSLFRPLKYRLATLPHERNRMRLILQSYGSSSLDYFKLWPDKSYFFSDSGKACIGYKVTNSVAISLGDPVGPVDELETLVLNFTNYCERAGWDVAFHQVQPTLLPLYKRLGFDAIKIGEEAILPLKHFVDQTSKEKEFRNATNKMEGEGYEYRIYKPPHSEEVLGQVEQVSHDWLAIPGRRERSFTLGRFDKAYLNETTIFAVIGPKGPIVAFANQVPSFKPKETTIDLMRHKVNVPNRTMDYLFLNLLVSSHKQGYDYFDLGLAPVYGVVIRPNAPLEERVLHWLFTLLGRFFSYKGMRSYKEKFQPNWEDRYLVYKGGVPGLAQTAIALARATEG